MSSERAPTFCSRRNDRAVPGSRRVRSRVRKRIIGIASLVSEVSTSSPGSPSGSTAPVTGIDDLGIKMVLPDVQPVLGLHALSRDPRAEHLRQSVHVDRVHPECRFDLLAHRIGPWLAAEMPILAEQVHGSMP